MKYIILGIGVWFLLGLIARGIIRGNNAAAIAGIDLQDREDLIGLYWMLRWERVALLAGPIGLWQVIHRSVEPQTSFRFFKFSLRPHKIALGLAYWPTYYHGRLIDISKKRRR